MMRLFRLSGLIAAAAVFAAAPARADEGMWTFDNFPIQTVNTKYGTRIDQAWLDRVRGATVRLSGCSASIVSAEGLILTNAHCVLPCLQQLSTAEADHVHTGWNPGTREEEKTCHGQTAEILTDITDVTDRVIGAGADVQGAAFIQARAAEVRRIEFEGCNDDPKWNCQIISFYRGGRYALYKFRKYEDVRLAFSPEYQAAFFGGDPDNFNFPRYSLDFGFLRLYEDGRPVATPNHLIWNPAAPRAGEPTFVSGNPGVTSRLLTMAQLERVRDQQLPMTLIQMSELRGRLVQYAAGDDEARRVSLDALTSLENSFKVYNGQEQALIDPVFMAAKRDAETELRERVAADPALAERIGDPWRELERVQTVARDQYLIFRQLESNAGSGSMLYKYAVMIVRAAKERARPADERSPGYSDPELAMMGRKIAAEQPIEPALEEINLSFWLYKTREYLTVDSPQVKMMLGDESPEAVAGELVEGTRLADAAFRAEAFAMTPEELAETDDPLIAFVLRTDDAAQVVRTQWELGVGVPTARAAERVAQARFAVYGDAQYPDATFSPRLSYGQVEGWTRRGITVEPFTRVRGLYERATGSAPFALADRWVEAEDRVKKDTVFAYVTTNDITGGNSGSAVVNGRGEVIGAAFDGNIHSIGGAFGYDGTVNRTVVISTAAITEALRNVYGQPRLLHELGVR